MKAPISLDTISPKDLGPIRGLCFDIDDTFSTEGKITPCAFEMLWKLKKKGFVLVPVTGRPAGWCDHIARFWPVDAVIGENGAFIFYMKEGVRSRLNLLSDDEEKKAHEELLNLKREIIKKFPQAHFASDQSYREYDLAVDFCEDVPPWKDEEVASLVALAQKHKAHAKVSSIHVNIWFGDYDKQRAMKFWLGKNCPGSTIKIPELASWLYIGDSPNDEPAFEFFQKSVGVANLSRFLPQLKTHPTWITKGKSGEGFVELGQKLLSL